MKSYSRRSIMWRLVASLVVAFVFGIQAWALHAGWGWTSDAHWHFYLVVSVIVVSLWALIWLLDWSV